MSLIYRRQGMSLRKSDRFDVRECAQNAHRKTDVKHAVRTIDADGIPLGTAPLTKFKSDVDRKSAT